MQAKTNSHPSSYRDPSGYIFMYQGLFYRQVNKIFREEFEKFTSSGLYQQLVNSKWLIAHEQLDENYTGDTEWYATLRPVQLPFISFPWEWSFDMLKDAALLTLDILDASIEKNFILKDATAYNIQFLEGKPIFIDTLSFASYDESQPWIAYRQFCEQFLGPLLLMHYKKIPLQNMYMAYPEGMPVNLVSKLLPGKSRFSIHTYLHIHLNAKMSRKAVAGGEKKVEFSRKKLKDLISSLRLLVRKLQLPEGSSTWSSYYEEASQRNNYLPDKKNIIEGWIKEIAGDLRFVADLGANDGEFSRLVSQQGIDCLAADLDPYCINPFYNKIKQQKETHLHPLIIDLSNPSPAIGLNNEERASFLDRCKADGILALALIHHLAIGKNIPLERIADLFAKVCKKWLIIEFVPKEDEKVKLMLSNKQDIYMGYTESAFAYAFDKFFRLVKKQPVADSHRTLYLFSRI